ncbi:MAG: HD domain-containing protein [Gemmatimonadetes bacterium]|nr:HD domain-containing protein [Gemmatimonadota bacterium]
MAQLHPIIEAAGRDQIHPPWAVMSESRREHTVRVGRLLWKWSKALGYKRKKRLRWRAAGLLHDALKGEDPAILRGEVEGGHRWPDPLLHGPACAARLRAGGVRDEKLLLAITYHTTGHPSFGNLGQALYIADYLDPGRWGKVRKRAEWRRRMPFDWRAVLEEVAAAKITSLIDRRVPIPPVTADFWRALV